MLISLLRRKTHSKLASEKKEIFVLHHSKRAARVGELAESMAAIILFKFVINFRLFARFTLNSNIETSSWEYLLNARQKLTNRSSDLA